MKEHDWYVRVHSGKQKALWRFQTERDLTPGVGNGDIRRAVRVKGRGVTVVTVAPQESCHHHGCQLLPPLQPDRSPGACTPITRVTHVLTDATKGTDTSTVTTTVTTATQ